MPEPRRAWVLWQAGSSWNAARTRRLTEAEADAGGVTVLTAVSECELAGLISGQEHISERLGQPR